MKGDVNSLLELLRDFWRSRRDDVAAKWQRSLPFGDYVVDRWEKARALGFGEGTSIYDSAVVIGDVSVGSRTWIGPGTVLDGSGGLSIGDNCSISAGVHIYSHDTVKWATSGGVHPYEYATTVIGSRCYLGPHAVVAKGVRIGDGAIVGSHSLVTVDVPPGCKAYGSPARLIFPVAGDAGSPHTPD